MTAQFQFTGEMPHAHAPLKLVVLIRGNYYGGYLDAASVEAFEKLMEDAHPNAAAFVSFNHSGGYLKFRPQQVDGRYVGPRPPEPPVNEQLLAAMREQVRVVKKAVNSGEEWREGGG